MHAFLLEFGISVPKGAAVISRLSTILDDHSLPLYLNQLLLKLQQHYHYLMDQIKELEAQLKQLLREDEVGVSLEIGTYCTLSQFINIINSHLAASDAGHWHYAMYVIPDEQTKVSLIKLFDSIKTVIRKSVPVPFDAKNREMFLFRAIYELEQATQRGDGYIFI